MLTLLFITNIIAYVLFALDKRLAEQDSWRIPESILLLSAFVLGAFGALCGMILCHHKTQRKVFYITIPVLLYIQLTLEILYQLFLR